jgi:hypothetical protein
MLAVYDPVVVLVSRGVSNTTSPRHPSFFCFLALFAKDFLKYVSGGKISKNKPFS